MRTPRPAVKALVQKGGRFLVLKKADRQLGGFLFDLPGGKMEFGERPAEALLREVKEETDLLVEVGKPLHMDTIIKTDDFHIVATVFLCTPRKGEIRLSAEHETYWWLTRSDVLGGQFPGWIKESVKRCGP